MDAVFVGRSKLQGIRLEEIQGGEQIQQLRDYQSYLIISS